MASPSDIDVSNPVPPSGERALAYWVLARNPHAAALVARAMEADPLEDLLTEYADTYWPGTLAEIVNDLDAWQLEWERYEEATVRPSPFGSDEAAFDRAYEAWQAAGPALPTSISGVVGMSGGEMRLLRCLAALGGPVRWEAYYLRALVDGTQDTTLVADLVAAYIKHP